MFESISCNIVNLPLDTRFTIVFSKYLSSSSADLRFAGKSACVASLAAMIEASSASFFIAAIVFSALIVAISAPTAINRPIPTMVIELSASNKSTRAVRFCSVRTLLDVVSELTREKKKKVERMLTIIATIAEPTASHRILGNTLVAPEKSGKR